MKKICFFNSESKWGGGEKWHFETARYLTQNKKNKVIVVGNKNSPLIKKCIDNRIKIRECEMTNQSVFNIFKILKFRKILREEKIDVVIANLPRDMKLASLAMLFKKNIRLVYRRGSAIEIKGSFLNKYFLEEKVDTIIVNSNDTKIKVLKNFENKNLESKIRLVHNYFDTSDYDKLQTPVNIARDNENQIIIGNLGRLSKQKGQYNFIEIAKELSDKGLDFKIYIAGIGPLKSELTEKIKEAGLENQVILLGFIKNIKDFMEKIDVFVMTSLWEGFGYVFLEAMYANRPIVAYDASSNKEVLDGYKGAELTSLFDNKDMANKIVELYNNKDEIIKSNQGKKIVETKYSKEDIMKKIEKILNLEGKC